MPEQLQLIQIGLLVVVSMVAWEFIRKMVQRFFFKTVESDYMTVEECRLCRETCALSRTEKNEELFKLIRRIESEVRSLRLVILKHMVHSDMTPGELTEMIDKLDHATEQMNGKRC